MPSKYSQVFRDRAERMVLDHHTAEANSGAAAVLVVGPLTGYR